MSSNNVYGCTDRGFGKQLFRPSSEQIQCVGKLEGCTECVNSKCEECKYTRKRYDTQNVSHVIQLDGNISVKSDDISDIVQNDCNDSIAGGDDDSDSDDNSETEYETDDEVDSTIDPVILTPSCNQIFSPNNPIQLEIKTSNQEKSSPLPL